MVLAQLKIGERLATCEALQMTFSGGPYPLFLSFYDQQRELVFAIQKFFLFHLFKYPFALSAIRLFSGTWVGLFQPSVCSGDLSVAISLSSNLELEPTSTSATCLHGSYFMSTRKTAFWIQERILFQCLSNISIFLLCKSDKKACNMKHLPSLSPFYYDFCSEIVFTLHLQPFT